MKIRIVKKVFRNTELYEVQRKVFNLFWITMSDYRHSFVYKWFKWKVSPVAAIFVTEESANNFIEDVRNNNNKVPDEIINEIKYKNSKTIIRQETI